MYNNYFLFKALADELRPVLRGGVVSACFSQSRDELIVQIELSDKSFFIRALVLPVFSCISFPSGFQRARKNSIDLFEPLVGQQIDDVLVVENDRSFYLQFRSGARLLFKMHGNRSNVIFIKPGFTNLIFKNQLTADFQLTIQSLRKDIFYTRQAFEENLHNPEAYFLTLGKPVWNLLYSLGFANKSVAEKWELFQQVLFHLNNPVFTIVRGQDGPQLSLLNEPTATQTFQLATKALTAFHAQWLSDFTFKKAYASADQQLRRALKETETRIRKLTDRLTELQQEDRFRYYADLLMANLHLITAGMQEVSLPDFATGKPVRIKLNPVLSPQKNAEVYYRKSRNRITEIQHLKEQQAKLERKHQQLLQQHGRLQEVRSLKELRLITQEGDGPLRAQPVKQRRPYHEVEYKGFVILIGKSARDNDELTLKHAHKNDLWLHVCDEPGSHVIIKHQPGKPFPKEVVERAAQLAAWHSKRKTESLCPVIVAERRHVFKRKGHVAGEVIAGKSRTLLVEPKGE